ncbi:MAG: filamentous hemagglutinin N-terminal domain-containing protein [Gammaproteobacteria bacterium]|nr:MAG: filamentous hemagglutinin N-terminal domain-containing protein [Gammaproteobacteria bacterium]
MIPARIRPVALAVAVASFGAFPALADTTLPTGGQVSAGSASIGTAGAAMTINQSSQRAVIRWNSFSIGSDASVTFNQPNSSAIALNRVLGNELSRIDGQLNANGQVFITNPNGVLFGSGAQVNVGGLVASTLDMDETDFMAGNQVLAGQSLAAVVNEGSITAGNVGLVGAVVMNNGSISTQGGATVLAAGERVSLAFDGNGLLTASVDQKVLAGLIENGGVIDVGNGRLLMTTGAASTLGATLVNNSGVIQATSLSGENGEIVLGGDAVVNTGSLDAGADGTIALTGNAVVSAASSMTGDVTVTAPIVVDPENVDPVALAGQIESYASANVPMVAALIDSGAIDLPLLVETLQGADLAAFLAGSMGETELAAAFTQLRDSGAIDLAAIAANINTADLAALLGELPVTDNAWLQTAISMLEANAIDPVALVNAMNPDLLAKIVSGSFAVADATGLLGSLVQSGAVNLNALASALTADQINQLLGQAVSPEMAPLVNQLVTGGALDLNKAATSLSPEQWQGLLDGSVNPVSLFTTLIASGAINLNTAAGQSLLASVFNGQNPVATKPPAPKKLSFQERMKLMMAKFKERMRLMRERMRRRT